jgi:hypothetical protein
VLFQFDVNLVRLLSASFFATNPPALAAAAFYSPVVNVTAVAFMSANLSAGLLSLILDFDIHLTMSRFGGFWTAYQYFGPYSAFVFERWTGSSHLRMPIPPARLASCAEASPPPLRLSRPSPKPPPSPRRLVRSRMELQRGDGRARERRADGRADGVDMQRVLLRRERRLRLRVRCDRPGLRNRPVDALRL